MRRRLSNDDMGNQHHRLDLLIRSGRYESAIQICDILLKENPNDTAARDCRDRARLEVEETTEKLRLSEEILKNDPNDFEGILDKGMALMQLGRVEDALNVMDAILRKDQDNCDIVYAKAVGLALNGKIDEAHECSKLLNNICPEHWQPTPISDFITLGKLANAAELNP